MVKTGVVADLAANIHDPTHAEALWWSLALGADFGGNMTAITIAFAAPYLWLRYLVLA